MYKSGNKLKKLSERDLLKQMDEIMDNFNNNMVTPAAFERVMTRLSLDWAEVRTEKKR